MTEAEEELNKSRNIPAVFANRIVLNNNEGLLRICFGDAMIGNDATFRQAVIMRTNDAMILAELIMKIVQEEQNKAVSH